MRKEIPQLKKTDAGTLLVVGGRPYFVRGGELHNSSASNDTYMEQFVWPCLKPLHMNTVLSPVCWEELEPEEGVYDFSRVDSMLAQCRREGMHWIPLWFGLWKNGVSDYIPAWMKKNPERYYMARDIYGKPLRTVSPLCDEAVEADAKAFEALMAYIRAHDEEEQTVIMVQVENEIGLLDSDRDYSCAANELYEAQVPRELSEPAGKSGTWEEVYQDEGGEKFIAFHFAKAVEKIASRGKAKYPLPMFMNTFLQMDFMIPGMYPSGGPILRNVDLWKAVASSIDFFSPDIYSENFQEIADGYARDDNPLFIPEVAGVIRDAAYVFYMAGRHNALGMSPFGIEEMFGELADDPDAAMTQLDNTMPHPVQGLKPGVLLARAYEIIDSMYDHIVNAHAKGCIHSFIKQANIGCILRMKNCLVRIKYKSGSTYFQTPDGFGIPDAENPDLIAGGFIIEEQENEFIIAGTNFYLEFLPLPGKKAQPFVLRKEEGEYVDGEWKIRRHLNGDERNNHNIGLVPRVMRMSIVMND